MYCMISFACLRYLLPFCQNFSLSLLVFCLSLSTVHVCKVFFFICGRLVLTCYNTSGLVVGLLFTKDQGPMYTFARVLVSSTCRWVRPTAHRHGGPHLSEVRALMPTLAVLLLCVCVIAERLGSLRCIAPAAGCGQFFGAPTSWRTSSVVRTVLRRNLDSKIWR